jgi:hypothetical protein
MPAFGAGFGRRRNSGERIERLWKNVAADRSFSQEHAGEIHKRPSGPLFGAVPGFENGWIAMEGLAHELFTRNDSA